MERLQKTIAASGLVSRREAERLIAAGRVEVNGTVINRLGTVVDPDADAIVVDGKPLPRSKRLVFVFYKPVGCVCSQRRQAKETIVSDYFKSFPSVYPVGRLDKESEGLLLVTNDGALAQKLTHPSYGHGKTYEIVVHWKTDRSPLEPPEIEGKLLKGVKLGDGKAAADQVAATRLPNDRLKIVVEVHEGRHHLIRRMCAAIGLDVERLKRTRSGPFTLANLHPGEHRAATTKELSSLS